MNLTSSSPLASGRTAEIFAYGEGRIVKLLRPGFPHSLVQQEYLITSAIVQAGLPAPKVFGTVEVDGRPGIIYERVDGPMLIALAAKHPLRLRQYAAIWARLHVELNRLPGGQLPRQKDILAVQIREAVLLPEETRAQVLALLDQLTEGGALCHNDLHPLNILMGPSGPVIIDWESASRGTPCADVARSYLTLALAYPAEGFPNRAVELFARLYLPAIASAYLSAYRKISQDPLPDFTAWSTVQAAAKVKDEPRAGQGRWLEVIRRGLRQPRP